MRQTTLNANGKLIVIRQPVVMGILNATPDSFYNQGRNSSLDSLLKKAEEMLLQGAFILDIGGMSTKPGSAEISEEEEWLRIEGIIKGLRKNFPHVLLSVDTYRSEIARRSAFEGIDWINDISSGSMDDQMFSVVAKLNLPYVMMHMQGQPRNMQENPQYENVTQDILAYFIEKIQTCEEAGIKDIIIDPGFGFGKTIAQNYELLNGCHQFSILEKRMLVGLSRKSMVYKQLDVTPDKALNGTTALNMIALQQGASILRVHDVKEAMECIALYAALK